MFMTSTTSPSNILFASMEESIYNMFGQTGQKLIEETVDRANRLKEELSNIKGLNVLSNNGYKTDPLKINFAVQGINGGTVREYLRNHNIDPEVFNSQSVLLSCHVGTHKDVYDIVPKAIKQLLNEGAPATLAKTICSPELPTPEYALNISESFERRREKRKLRDAVGMVSGSIYSPCPPGCIVIDIGEEIQEGHLKFFGEDFELEVLVE